MIVEKKFQPSASIGRGKNDRVQGACDAGLPPARPRGVGSCVFAGPELPHWPKQKKNRERDD